MGRLTKVKDEYGRVSTYTWNHTDGIVSHIDYLLRSESDAGSYARRASFTYGTSNGQRVVSRITYTAPDGLGEMASRWVEFSYTVSNGRVLVSQIRRQVLGGSSSVTTGYSYDASGRVITVTQTGQPNTSYAYGISTSFGGATITLTQGSGSEAKQSIFEHDTSGRLRRQQVKDYNPDSAQTTWLTWNYFYHANGSTARIDHPSGRREDYGYDARGNLTSITTRSGSTIVRSQTFAYDSDNRLSAETLPARSGTADGASYDYQEVRVSYDYAAQAPYSTSQAGQTFTVPKRIRRTTSVGGVQQFYLDDDYDTHGRLVQSRRVGAGQTRTTTYTYWAGEAWQPYKPTESGNPDWQSRLPSARQYRDLVKAVTVDGLGTAEFSYDAFGNVAFKREDGSFVRDYNGTTPVLGDRQSFYSYTGFGQPVWHYLRQGDASANSWTVAARSLTVYHATGEPHYSWEGTPSNHTLYSYTSTGSNLGRLHLITQGIGSSGSITTQRQRRQFSYDSFGRVASELLDGSFTTSYSYDTLDRVVKEVRPDGGRSHTRYHSSGVPNRIDLYEPKPTPAVTYTTTMDVDALGRVTRVSYPGGATVSTSYDAFDRPIRVLDNRLTMNAAGNDRASYYLYDSLGKVLRELGPALRTVSDSQLYSDARRPLTVYAYDALGRKTRQHIYFGTSATNIDLSNFKSYSVSDNASGFATTQFSYDPFDRPIAVTDPEGYSITRNYDASGNLTAETRRVWKGSEADYSLLRNGFDTVTTRYAYDALGRLVKTRDPRGHTRTTSYDLLGNVSAVSDERGIKILEYGYSADGLLQSVKEPHPSSSSMVTTKYYSYGNRRFPSAMRAAHMNTQASASAGALTQYEVDWAGRVTKTTLPGGATLTQSYDTRGNLLLLSDAEGFRSQYRYDAFNRLVEEQKLKRTSGAGKTADDAAFPNINGLTTSYSYDAAGNLLQENRHGLITRYRYNSLGQVIGESKAHTSGSGAFKLKAYRLDGALSAQTSYDYAGSLRGGDASIVAAITATGSVPSVTAGNLTRYTFNRRGEATTERSRGKQHPSGSVITEHTSYYAYTGLGQRASRRFEGSSAIYALQNRNDGTATGSANYNSYWKYDPNGNLTQSWDTLPGVPQGPSGSDNQARNIFSYSYSPSNKELSQSRNVRASVRPRSETGELDGAVLLAATTGSVISSYNNRDLLASTTVIDNSAQQVRSVGKQISRTTDYSYYLDGLVQRIDVTGVGHQTFSYDTRGRVTSNYDANGNGKGYATTTTTSYESHGRVDQTVVRHDNNSTIHRTHTIPTLIGLVREMHVWSSGAVVQCTNTGKCPTEAFVYDANGQLHKRTRTVVETQYWENCSSTSCEARSGDYPVTYITDFSYDVHGNQEHMYQERQAQFEPDEYPRRLFQTNAYNANGDLIQETKRPTASSTVTVTYALDSRGNRLSVGGTTSSPHNPYRNFTKRYDAEGRAVQFNRPSHTTDQIAYDYHLLFRYDPFSNQVLTADVSLRQEMRSGIQHYYSLYRKSYSTIATAGEAQLIRARNGNYGYQRRCLLSCWWEERDTYSSNDTFKDQTFSLADGMQSGAWTIVEPFDLVEQSELALAAPREAISDLIGVLPLEVAPPPSSTPAFGQPGEIAPPGADDIDQSTSGLSSPTDFNVASTGLAELPKLSQLPAGSEHDAPTLPAMAEQQAAPFDLAPPTTALPPALAEVQTSEVTAPGQPHPSPPGVENPGEVTRPGETAPPPLGPSPSDGSAEVTPPYSIGTPVIPPIGPGPEPIVKVTPPLGWQPEAETAREIAALMFDPGGGGGRVRPPSNLPQEHSETKRQQDQATGGDSKPNAPAASERETRESLKANLTSRFQGMPDEFADRMIDNALRELATRLHLKASELPPSLRVVALQKLERHALAANTWLDAYRSFTDEVWAAAVQAQQEMAGWQEGMVVAGGVVALRPLPNPAGLAIAAGVVLGSVLLQPAVDVEVFSRYYRAETERGDNAPASSLSDAAGGLTTPPSPQCPQGVDCSGDPTLEQLTAAARRAREAVGPGFGRVHGTRVHSAFQREVNALGRRDLHTEISYLRGDVVLHGTRGSVRLDVVQGSISRPTAIYDLKTGNALLTRLRIEQIRRHLPSEYRHIPIHMIR
jgi:YD repeat-containing protein